VRKASQKFGGAPLFLASLSVSHVTSRINLADAGNLALGQSREVSTNNPPLPCLFGTNQRGPSMSGLHVAVFAYSTKAIVGIGDAHVVANHAARELVEAYVHRCNAMEGAVQKIGKLFFAVDAIGDSIKYLNVIGKQIQSRFSVHPVKGITEISGQRFNILYAHGRFSLCII
jgi:hypothetical protein